MTHYKHILACLDLLKEDDQPVIARAAALARQNKAKLSIIHVIEPPSSYGTPYEVPMLIDWQEELQKTAVKHLEKIGKKYDIPEKRRLLPMGRAKQEILAAAAQSKCDLIVIGSHGRHGLDLLLLGSTANGVLHGAPCDVLAVHTGE